MENNKNNNIKNISLDIYYISGMRAINDLERLFRTKKHLECEEFPNEIIEFFEKITI